MSLLLLLAPSSYTAAISGIAGPVGGSMAVTHLAPVTAAISRVLPSVAGSAVALHGVAATIGGQLPPVTGLAWVVFSPAVAVAISGQLGSATGQAVVIHTQERPEDALRTGPPAYVVGRARQWKPGPRTRSEPR